MEDGNYCHKCGAPLSSTTIDIDAVGRIQASRTQGIEPLGDAEQRRITKELLSIDPKSDKCHACGRKERLHRWEFGLGKPVSSRPAWGGTALSVAVSAVALPLIGVGALQLPGKKVSYRVLRLSLVLCEDCWKEQTNYTVHPWWQAAGRLGYKDFFDAEQLKALKPAG